MVVKRPFSILAVGLVHGKIANQYGVLLANEYARAMDMATEFPHCSVIGADIAPMDVG